MYRTNAYIEFYILAIQLFFCSYKSEMNYHHYFHVVALQASLLYSALPYYYLTILSEFQLTNTSKMHVLVRMR